MPIAIHPPQTEITLKQHGKANRIIDDAKHTQVKPNASVSWAQHIRKLQGDSCIKEDNLTTSWIKIISMLVIGMAHVAPSDDRTKHARQYKGKASQRIKNLWTCKTRIQFHLL